jgi:hypothetical protein
MLILRTHAWTPLQKGLIMGAGIIALICLGMLVYTYERYHRGPSESAFFGVWETDGPYSDDPCDYIEFRPDQTFSVSWSPNMDEETSFIVGRWYAGGPNIYVVVKPEWSGELYRPLVFPIMDLKPDEFRVSIRDDYIKAFRRVHLPPSRASNHAMERTADRSASTF